MIELDRKLLLLACVLLVAAGAHVGEGVGASESAPGQRRGASQTAPRPASAAGRQDGAQVFRGRIGDRLRVQVRLRREGDALSGSYSYEGRTAELSLKGSAGAQGDFTLREYTAAGAQTGVFKGKWETAPTGADALTGEWSRPDGTRALPFYLAELPVTLAAGAELVTRTITEDNKKGGYTVAAEYPRIEGAAAARFDGFNRAVAAAATEEVNDFRKNLSDWEPVPGTGLGSYIDAGYLVGVVADDFVSVQFEISHHFSGAAHPNHHTRVINYDVKRARALRLADLFKPSAPYLRALSDYCVKDLKRQFREDGWSEPEQLDEGVEEGAAPKADNYKSWLVTPKGLAVTFDPYQVAPYAAGPQHVLIPYAALRDIIDPGGPLAPFAR